MKWYSKHVQKLHSKETCHKGVENTVPDKKECKREREIGDEKSYEKNVIWLIKALLTCKLKKNYTPKA